jgi:hypothetical protein
MRSNIAACRNTLPADTWIAVVATKRLARPRPSARPGRPRAVDQCPGKRNGVSGAQGEARGGSVSSIRDRRATQPWVVGALLTFRDFLIQVTSRLRKKAFGVFPQPARARVARFWGRIVPRRPAMLAWPRGPTSSPGACARCRAVPTPKPSQPTSSRHCPRRGAHHRELGLLGARLDTTTLASSARERSSSRL